MGSLPCDKWEAGLRPKTPQEGPVQAGLHGSGSWRGQLEKLSIWDETSLLESLSFFPLTYPRCHTKDRMKKTGFVLNKDIIYLINKRFI